MRAPVQERETDPRAWTICAAEVVVVAEAQVSAPPDTATQNEPPPLAPPDPGADVHKDADGSHAQQGGVQYYSHGQPGVLGNPPMVVISPYHSMVSANACIVRSTMHGGCAELTQSLLSWSWSRAAAGRARAWNCAAALISALCRAHEHGARCTCMPSQLAPLVEISLCARSEAEPRSSSARRSGEDVAPWLQWCRQRPCASRARCWAR
jgi:hypothetical protein